MEKTLSGYKIRRLEGATRYETNIQILKEAGVTTEDIIVCTGANYADSLSASASKKPILLVSDKLSEKQKTYLYGIDSKKYYIIGGTSAINTSVENALKSFGTTKRLGGSNRYETSILVAKEFVKNPSALVVAYGQNFPDGLCGGPLASNMNAPLILTQNGYEKAATGYAENLPIEEGVVLGGPGLVSDSTVRTIFSLGRYEEILVR